FASRDWHPPVTRHFKEYGGIWPVHCVQDTPGAAFHARLRLPTDAEVITKGSDPAQDAYSAFQATTTRGELLAEALRRWGARHVYAGGLATDYCVQQPYFDALAHGTRAPLRLDVSPSD